MSVGKARTTTGSGALRIPYTIMVISITGLVMALIGNGIFDVISWLLLGTPLVVLAMRARFSGHRKKAR